MPLITGNQAAATEPRLTAAAALTAAEARRRRRMQALSQPAAAGSSGARSAFIDLWIYVFVNFGRGRPCAVSLDFELASRTEDRASQRASMATARHSAVPRGLPRSYSDRSPTTRLQHFRGWSGSVSSSDGSDETESVLRTPHEAQARIPAGADGGTARTSTPSEDVFFYLECRGFGTRELADRTIAAFHATGFAPGEWLWELQQMADDGSLLGSSWPSKTALPRMRRDPHRRQ